MSIALIAVFVVLLLSHALPALAGWRRLERGWSVWRDLGVRWGSAGSGAMSVLWIALPVLGLLALQAWLAQRWWGLLLLPYGVLMLFLCWGPRDLEADARSVADAENDSAAQRARQALGIPARAGHSGSVVVALFRAGKQRWFGPLFWFVLIGGAGALLYRLAFFACREQPRQGAALDWLCRLLNWPVAALMTLSLALVANFDAVLAAWRRWHAAPGRPWFGNDFGFLDAAAQSSVVCELHEEAEEAAEDAADAAEHGAAANIAPPSDDLVPTVQAAVEDSLSLLRRILLLWMALLALAVIGGVAG